MKSFSQNPSTPNKGLTPRMIVYTNFLADFVMHFVMLFLFGAYFAALLDMQKLPNIVVALVGAFFITFVTHMWFPRARIQRLYA